MAMKNQIFIYLFLTSLLGATAAVEPRKDSVFHSVGLPAPWVG